MPALKPPAACPPSNALPDSEDCGSSPWAAPDGLVQIHRHDEVALARELVQGLLTSAATVEPKYLYDSLGSRLFEAITELPEYYPTRTEQAILAQHRDPIASAAGTVGTLIDLGAGNCEKAMRLLPTLRPARYVAVDISVDFLADSVANVRRSQPGLEVLGIGLDFSSDPSLPSGSIVGRPVFFYPGSSIGNFTPTQACGFLRGIQRQAAGGGLIIGVDLVKAIDILEPAYDDALGVTAAFNLNLLRHLNRLIGSDFDPRDWQHVAFFNTAQSRIEMHLQAREALTVRWPGGERRFEAAQRLHTENSYKYTVEDFAALLRAAGFRGSRCWVDPKQWFAVFWAEA